MAILATELSIISIKSGCSINKVDVVVDFKINFKRTILKFCSDCYWISAYLTPVSNCCLYLRFIVLASPPVSFVGIISFFHESMLFNECKCSIDLTSSASLVLSSHSSKLLTICPIVIRAINEHLI